MEDYKEIVLTPEQYSKLKNKADLYDKWASEQAVFFKTETIEYYSDPLYEVRYEKIPCWKIYDRNLPKEIVEEIKSLRLNQETILSKIEHRMKIINSIYEKIINIPYRIRKKYKIELYSNNNKI